MMEKSHTKDQNPRKTKSCFLSLASYFLLSKKKAQVMIEFAFCMIILFLMMYGTVMVFRWVGLDLGRRQKAHEELLKSDIDLNYGGCVTSFFNIVTGNVTCTDYRNVTRGPLTQIDPYFYTPESMNAVWAGH